MKPFKSQKTINNMMLPDFRVRQRDYLLEIARALTEELDLDKVLGRILKISLEMLAGQAGVIALRDVHEGWRLAVADGLGVPLIRFLEPLLKQLPDQEDPESTEVPAISRIINQIVSLASFGLLTGVGIPLVARGQVIGVIFIFRSYMGTFSSNDRILLKSFANQAAVAVANAQLYRQVTEEKHRMDGLLDSAADGILILYAQINYFDDVIHHLRLFPREQLMMYPTRSMKKLFIGLNHHKG